MRWSAQALDGTVYTAEGPIPRTGETVRLPGDRQSRKVVRVIHTAHPDFNRSTDCTTRVVLELEEPG